MTKIMMTKTAIKTINTTDELKAEIEQLVQIETKFLPIYKNVGVPELRRKNEGFSALMRAMVGQQLSVSVANRIWERLQLANLTNVDGIQQADDEALLQCGLSRQKVRYVRSLVAQQIDFQALLQLDDEQVIDILTAVTGIGRWTAQMYLLFSLGRSDVLAVDDLAIKVAVQAMFELETRPTPKQLQELTQSWSPYRSASSLLLWSYYGWLKNKEALPV